MRRLDLPRAASIAAVVVAAVVAAAAVPLGVRLLDEGNILYNGWLVSGGLRPYSDFFALYPPTMFEGLGLLFRVTGPSALAARATVLVCALAVAGLNYWFAERLAGRTAALVTAALTLLWGVPIYNSPFPNWYALPLLQAAGALLVIRAGRPTWLDGARGTGVLLLAGVSLGVAATIKQSIGLLALVAFVLLTVSAERRREGRPWFAALLLIAGWAAPVLATAAWLMAIGSGAAALADVFVFPFRHRAQIVARELPALSSGGALALAAYGALVVFPRRALRGAEALVERGAGWYLAGGLGVVALAWWLHPPTGGLTEIVAGAGWALAFYGIPVTLAGAFMQARYDARVWSGRGFALGSCLCVTAVMFLEAGGALDWSHLFYSVLPLLPVAVVTASRAASVTRRLGPAVGLVVTICMVGPPFEGAVSPWLSGGAEGVLSGSYAGVRVSAGRSREVAAVARLLRSADPSRPVYVYPVDAGLYFAAERRGAGLHSQFVHAFTPEETAVEADRVLAADPGAVVVRRIPGPDPVGYGRWYSYGRPVIERVLRDATRVARFEEFDVYERTGRP